MSLKTTRAALAAQLEAETGVTAHDHVPDSIEPPCLVIAPADGYVSGGQTFGEQLVQLDVWVLVELGGDNEATTDNLDDLIETVVGSLGEWIQTASGQPGPVETAEWQAHGLNLTVATQINL